jgi:DNA-binding NtrC family response regulator
VGSVVLQLPPQCAGTSIFRSYFSQHTHLAETVARAVESGAFGYLLKPYTVPELKATIEIALHKHNTETAMRRALSSRSRPMWHNLNLSRQPLCRTLLVER